MHTHVHTHMHISTHAYIHSIVEALHDFSQKHTHELKKSLAPQPNFPKGQTMLSPDFALGRRSQICSGDSRCRKEVGWVERTRT